MRKILIPRPASHPFWCIGGRGRVGYVHACIRAWRVGWGITTDQPPSGANRFGNMGGFTPGGTVPVERSGTVASRWHGLALCLVVRTSATSGHSQSLPQPATASHSHSQSHMEQRRPTAFKCLQLPRDYAERTPGVRGDEPCQAETFKARSPQRHYIKDPQWQL